MSRYFTVRLCMTGCHARRIRPREEQLHDAFHVGGDHREVKLDLHFGQGPVSRAREAAKVLELGDLGLDNQNKSWYLQKMSNYIYEAEPGRAFEIQQAAFEYNNAMLCPPGVVKRPISMDKSATQMTIITWYKSFSNWNGAIAAIADLRARLSYGMTPKTLENAVKELASLLGAIGSRPEEEFGEGPDDLWLWPSHILAIEV